MNQLHFERTLFDVLGKSLGVRPGNQQYTLFCRSALVMGGAVVNTITGEPVRDFDIYFEDSDDLQAFLRFYDRRITLNRLEDGTYEIGDLDKLAQNNGRSTFYLTEQAASVGKRLQFITKFVGDFRSICGTFDYEHCKVGWRPLARPQAEGLKGEMLVPETSMREIATKNLRYNPDSSYYRLSAFIRMQKFLKRGWNISPDSILLLANDLKSLDLEDPKVLRAELRGFYAVDKITLDKAVVLHTKENRVDLQGLCTTLQAYA